MLYDCFFADSFGENVQSFSYMIV